MQSAVFSLVYTSTWPAPFLVYTSTWPAQSLVYTSTWPAQLWGGIQLSSPWYTHYLASSVLSIHITWPAQFLVYTFPGQLSSWYTRYLASSVVGRTTAVFTSCLQPWECWSRAQLVLPLGGQNVLQCRLSLGLLGHLGRRNKESGRYSLVSLPNVSVSILSRRPRIQHKVQEAPEWQAMVSKLDQCRARSYR